MNKHDGTITLDQLEKEPIHDAGSTKVKFDIDVNEYAAVIEHTKEVMDRLKLLGKVHELETEIHNLTVKYNRLDRSNQGLAAEGEMIRLKSEEYRRKFSVANAIIANAETYIAEHKKVDREELLTILMKKIE